MSKRNDSWGIEVGANAIKAVRLLNTGAEVSLVEYDLLPFKKVLTTPDLNVAEAVQVGLEQFLARHDVAGATVTVSVPGSMAFARFAKLPPVEPKKIPDIVKFEAVQQIPFPIDQVEWDYQVFAYADSPDVEVGIFAVTKEKASAFLADYRTVGLRVDGLTLSPLAVYNALAYDLELNTGSEGVILMDIGTTSTDVIIVEQGRVWLRTLPIGGNNFTDALVRAFKLGFPKAEKLKREASTSKYARQIFQAMRPVFADLVQEIQRSLGYYQSLNRDADLKRVIGLGSTFRLPGLQKFLKQQLQMEVDRPTTADGQPGFRRIAIEGAQQADLAENAINLATAYGLALQGLGLGTVRVNVLPAQTLEHRMWKAKLPWFGAAAALFVVGSGLYGYRLHNQNSQYVPQLQAVAESANVVIGPGGNGGKAGLWVRKIASIEGTDPRQEIVNYRDILTYHDLWPGVVDDINKALASVDPTFDPENPKNWREMPRPERQAAYLEWIRVKHLGGKPPEDWWKEKGDIRVAAGNDREPKHFVVTLRGYTPHKDGIKLIEDSVIRWLETNGAQPGRPYRIRAHKSAFDPMQRGQAGGMIDDDHAPPRAGQEAAIPEVAQVMGATAREDNSRDWVFTIRFIVDVLTPEQVRAAQVASTQPAETRKEGQP